MIIDADSHLRDIYFLDEIYKLEGHWAKYSPRKVGSGQYMEAEFTNVPDPRQPKVRLVQEHRFMSDPKVNWRGGDYSKRQVGGWDMALWKPL